MISCRPCCSHRCKTHLPRPDTLKVAPLVAKNMSRKTGAESISIHIHVCICTRVCIYIHVYIYTHTHMYVCMHACMHVCMYACMHACMHVCMYAYIYIYMDQQRRFKEGLQILSRIPMLQPGPDAKSNFAPRLPSTALGCSWGVGPRIGNKIEGLQLGPQTGNPKNTAGM